MHIVDSHEFYEMYRGDKDLRLGIELCRNFGVKYTVLVPNVASPADRKFFQTPRFPKDNLPALPEGMEIRYLKAKLIYFSKQNLSLGGFFQFSSQYPKSIKDINPDLIFENPYTTLTPRSYFTYLSSLINDIPLVYIDAGDIPRKGLLKKALNKIESKVVNNSRLIITYNHLGKERFTNEYGYPPSKIMVVPKPVDTVKFSPNVSGNEIRKMYKIEKKYIVAYVGRLSNNKGAKHLLMAAKKINEQGLGKDIHFMFIGGNIIDKDAQEIRVLHRKLGLKNVHFTGKVKHDIMNQYQAAADLIVYPDVTNLPGFSTVLSESMAMGKPIVLGIKGYETAIPIEDEKTGLIIKPRSVEEIVSAIIRIKDDEYFGKALGKNVRKYAEEYMDWNVIAHKYHKLFKKVIA